MAEDIHTAMGGAAYQLSTGRRQQNGGTLMNIVLVI